MSFWLGFNRDRICSDHLSVISSLDGDSSKLAILWDDEWYKAKRLSFLPPFNVAVW